MLGNFAPQVNPDWGIKMPIAHSWAEEREVGGVLVPEQGSEAGTVKS